MRLTQLAALFIVFVAVVFALALAFTGCASYSDAVPVPVPAQEKPSDVQAPGEASLPAEPAADKLVNIEPLRCDGEALYMKVYDPNPATNAVHIVIGVPGGAPFLAAIAGDDGVVSYFLLEAAGKVTKMTMPEWDARFGDHNMQSICRARQKPI